MIAHRSQLLRDADSRFELAPIDPVWRNQREASADAPLTAEEIFAAYLDELLDDDDSHGGSDCLQRRSQTATVSREPSVAETARYTFDDILRQAIATVDYSPLG